jgi:hypothetical protein
LSDNLTNTCKIGEILFGRIGSRCPFLSISISARQWLSEIIDKVKDPAFGSPGNRKKKSRRILCPAILREFFLRLPGLANAGSLTLSFISLSHCLAEMEMDKNGHLDPILPNCADVTSTDKRGHTAGAKGAKNQ